MKFLNPFIKRIATSNTAKKILAKEGKRIMAFPNGIELKMLSLFKQFNIDVVLDVGANIGQYAGYLRHMQYKGAIISFEPLNDAFAELQQKVEKDELWKCYNYALGKKNEETFINVSQDSQSSSILQSTSQLNNAQSSTAYIKKQPIHVKTLDSVFDELTKGFKNVYLKIDVQGFEKDVLEGAEISLTQIKGIQVEMSFVELYENEMLFTEMFQYLESKGFFLCALRNGFMDVKTGRLLQADGIFYKTN